MILRKNSEFSCSILTQIIPFIPLNPQDHFFIPKYIYFAFYHLYHLQTYYRFTVTLLIFNWYLHHHFFFLQILSYILFFVTILHPWNHFIILIIFYPSKLVTNFANITNFKPKIYNSPFNFVSTFKFIHRCYPHHYISYLLLFFYLFISFTLVFFCFLLERVLLSLFLCLHESLHTIPNFTKWMVKEVKLRQSLSIYELLLANKYNVWSKQPLLGAIFLFWSKSRKTFIFPSRMILPNLLG